jgi:copper homeostasis protein
MASSRKIIVEACVGSLSDALLAASSGTDRLEFCAALDAGGLTPDFDELRQLRAAVDIPIVAMVRPRGGDFNYSETEWSATLSDAEKALSLGTDGIVFGVLTKDQTIDADKVLEMASVVRRNPGKEIIFHRAFDEVRNFDESYSLLAGLNIDRILTSGGAATILEGAAAIEKLVTASAKNVGKPAIIAGGGVRSDNAVEILRRTGIRQLHSACGTDVSPLRLDPDKLRRLLEVVRNFERSSEHWRMEPEN